MVVYGTYDFAITKEVGLFMKFISVNNTDQKLY